MGVGWSSDPRFSANQQESTRRGIAVPNPERVHTTKQTNVRSPEHPYLPTCFPDRYELNPARKFRKKAPESDWGMGHRAIPRGFQTGLSPVANRTGMQGSGIGSEFIWVYYGLLVGPDR